MLHTSLKEEFASSQGFSTVFVATCDEKMNKEQLDMNTEELDMNNLDDMFKEKMNKEEQDLNKEELDMNKEQLDMNKEQLNMNKEELDMNNLDDMFEDKMNKEELDMNKEQLDMNNLDDMFNDSLDELFNTELSVHMEKLSPFKKPPQENVTLINKEVKKLLEEGVGKESYCYKGDYGRYIVTQVERDHYKGELLLHLVSPYDQSNSTCTLAGFWNQSVVVEGDLIHILFTEAVDGHFTLDNNKGVLVVNPDFLVSGTSVVAGVFCRRKAVLNERFKGIDPPNQVMLIGSLVHELFQEVVKKKIHKYDELVSLVRRLMSGSKAVRDMYGLGLSHQNMYEEMTSFLPHIHTWSQKYLAASNSRTTGKHKLEKGQRRNQWSGEITEILDIEENLWSPRFGVKGKIDMTVQIHQRNNRKVVPLELKTGRSTFSAEHKGQVTLYSMMSSDRRPDPQAGLLLYLRDGAMEEVSAGEKEKRGLLQLRNEIVQHLTAKPIPQLGDQLPPQLPSLPEPIDFDRACVKCGQLLTCTVYQKAVEQNVPQQPHPMANLVPTTTAHLKESHLEYFRHWCLLLHLEMDDNRRSEAIRALWLQDPIKRESSGDCLCYLVLDEGIEVSEARGGEFVQVLRRSPSHHTTTSHTSHTPLSTSHTPLSTVHSPSHHTTSHTPLSTVSLQAGDSIIVSSESDIALSMGVILSIKESSIEISLDRNLCQYPDWREKVFHIDRYEYQNSMGTTFTNLARLLQDTPHHAKLRSLIIDREPPTFKKGLLPDVVTKGRHILKNLNKQQQRAVLRTLMTEHYSLLKGYPGTGKTSTIVAIVRMMVTLGLSVLITSYTHSAVDNILLKLRMYEVDFLRLGRTTRIHTDILPYADELVTRKFTDVPSLSQFYDSKLVVATTCLGVNHVLFSKRTFDFCIIDEASQVLQAAALGPLFHASCFVLVGDPQQLPPVIKSKQAKSLGMSESLFVRLDSQGATSDLSDQYRMNGPIMRLANQLMYDNKLKCGNTDVETASLQLTNYYMNVIEDWSVSEWVQKIVEPRLESSVVFVDTCGRGRENRDKANRVINTSEAGLVVTLLHTLLKSGVTTDDVGVITPYRAQVMLIRDGLAREVMEGQRVEVNTVDQYQGRDKSVVVYSCVRSGASHIDPGDILQDEHRLNVAVTRAKHKLIIIGDKNTLQSYQPFRKLTTLLQNQQIYQLKDEVDGFRWQDYLLF
ncbi:hypothetical protein Pmani_026446 [Petrolisthes manimaculis]|uniref:DNA replication ATP-dependent helicase/nuclease n=1 Tax=Petrolisthes manimaculis TaxID=1843537 RepID=A0AAE1TXF0_9EUCA|nr:hypothetical protein Pmani_026446 [Petrolisthes manimaculis]